jgi:hypothetical protein
MEVNGQLHATAALHPAERDPGTYFNRRLGRPQSRSERGDEEKNSLHLPEIEPRK